jgi:hypothetical protein
MLQSLIHRWRVDPMSCRQNFTGQAQLELQTDVCWGIAPMRISRASG